MRNRILALKIYPTPQCTALFYSFKIYSVLFNFNLNCKIFTTSTKANPLPIWAKVYLPKVHFCRGNVVNTFAYYVATAHHLLKALRLDRPGQKYKIKDNHKNAFTYNIIFHLTHFIFKVVIFLRGGSKMFLHS